ncbi:LppX_LprAFG lipoprotein [Mycobacterium sp.]|uniref:LppX_LprAFG lipoprotein n=1 Tax=Mycobacterium sp. TaxID=1785 RepID=UPI0031E22A06
MQTRRRLPALLAALSIATALLGGCSSSPKQNSGPLPDAANLVQQSSVATKKVTSAHLVFSVEGTIPSLPVKTITGDLTTVPGIAAKGDAKITFSGPEVDVPFVVYDSVLYAALTPNKWANLGPAADVYDLGTLLDPTKGLANLLANLSGATAQGRDTINGQDTVRLAGKVSADAVNALAPQLKATEPRPVTVWIQEDGEHQLVQAKLEQSAGNFLQMTLSNWNEPVQVSKPNVS